jgi:hypothetical protein
MRDGPDNPARLAKSTGESFQWVPGLALQFHLTPAELDALPWVGNYMHLARIGGTAAVPFVCIGAIRLMLALGEVKPEARLAVESHNNRWVKKHAGLIDKLSSRWNTRFARFFTRPWPDCAVDDPGALSLYMRRVWTASAEWSARFMMLHGSQALEERSEAKRAWMAEHHLGDERHTLIADAVFDMDLISGENLGFGLGMAPCSSPPRDRTGFIPAVTTVEIGIPEWDRAFESRRSYEKRALAAIAAQVRRRLEVDPAHGRKGAALLRGKRDNRHFSWFVRFQVMDESFTAIGRSEEVARQAVTMGVQETAALLDIPLRASSAGRPPEIRTRSTQRMPK